MKVWDLHCDTLSELRKAEHAGRPKSFAQNDLHIDLEKLQKGDYLLQCFAAFVNLGDKTPGADPLVTALEEIDQFKRIMAAYPEKIAPVYTAADIRRNAAAGKISGMLTIEEGACCKGSVRRGPLAGVSSATGWIRWRRRMKTVWRRLPPRGRSICMPANEKDCTLFSRGALCCREIWPGRRPCSFSPGRMSTPSAKRSWPRRINTATPECCVNALNITAKKW